MIGQIFRPLCCDLGRRIRQQRKRNSPPAIRLGMEESLSLIYLAGRFRFRWYTLITMVQYVPAPNGFAFGLPYVMPCWASAISPPEVLARGAREENASLSNRAPLQWWIRDAKIGKTPVKNGSTGSSSSVLTNHRSGSFQGKRKSPLSIKCHKSLPFKLVLIFSDSKNNFLNRMALITN